MGTYIVTTKTELGKQNASLPITILVYNFAKLYQKIKVQWLGVSLLLLENPISHSWQFVKDLEGRPSQHDKCSKLARSSEISKLKLFICFNGSIWLKKRNTFINGGFVEKVEAFNDFNGNTWRHCWDDHLLVSSPSRNMGPHWYKQRRSNKTPV